MHLAWRGCAALLVVAACGGDDGGKGGTPDAPTVTPDPNEGAHSGTRLRLQWRDYGSVKTAAGMYDNQLGTTCTPVTWTDGNTYCTPSSQRIVYTDKGCTQPIGQAPHPQGCTATAPSYFVASDIVSCTPRAAHLYAAGQLTTAVPYFMHDSITGECFGPLTSSANFDYYTVGAEVSPTTLIPLTRSPVTPADTGRIQRRFLTSSDGAAAFTTPQDTMLDIECSPTVIADATSTVCAPNATQATYFNDASCTVGELVTRSQCSKPMFASQSTAPECGVSSTSYFSVGAEVTDHTVYTPSGTCTSTDGPLDSQYYLLGAPLGVAPMTRSRDTTAGRTLQLIHTSGGSAAMRDTLLFDTQHNAECEEFVQLDGTVRCLPRSGNVTVLYTNAGCSQQVLVLQLFQGPDTCAKPAVPAQVTRALPLMAPTTCGTTFEVYDVGAQVTGTLYSGTPAACVEVTATGTASYALGPQHPLTEFPMATVSRD